MDVIRLNKASFYPNAVVEGYTSMIWTERYLEPGDFELKTFRVSETMTLLPKDSLISVLDSSETMMVENHSITIDDEGIAELTVSGRSLDAFLEHRYVEAPYSKRRKMAKSYPNVGAAAVLIWNAVNNPTGKDVTREGDFGWTLKDEIPNTSVTDSVHAPGEIKRRWLKEGPLYPQLFNFLLRDDLGLRTIRPQDTTAQRVSVASALATRGEITRTTITNITTLRFDIYQGYDRTELQPNNTKVIFNELQGTVDNASYLFSTKEAKTACEIISGQGGADVYRVGESGFVGINRRVMSYDGGDPEIPAEPEKPEHPKEPKSTASQAEKDAYQTDMDAYRDALDIWQPKHTAWVTEKNAIIAQFLEDVTDEAFRALKKQRKVTLFTGEISPFSPYKYEIDYNLGDTVTLYGNYNTATNMVVNEYTRTEDAEGDRGYPGLVLP